MGRNVKVRIVSCDVSVTLMNVVQSKCCLTGSGSCSTKFSKFESFQCLFINILEYCNQLWHFNIPEYLSKDIERIQHRALKIIQPSLSYDEALVVSNIQMLHSRREQLCLTFFKNKVIPESSPLTGLVEIAADPGYDLRAVKKFALIKCVTSRFKNSFFPSSVEQFNASCI